MSKFKLRKKTINLRKKKYFEIKIGNNIIDSFHNKINLSKNKIIGGYFPINFEFDCLQILKKFYSNGYSISLPIIKRNHQMDFYKWDINDPLTISSFGIPQPLKLKKVYPDIIFVPMVAFDKYRNRIGYGGGFYDRYLEKISQSVKDRLKGDPLRFVYDKEIDPNTLKFLLEKMNINSEIDSVIPGG